MNERKYKIGQIVEHKLTKEKMLILRNSLADPNSNNYIVRRINLENIEVVEEELEEAV